MLCFDPRGADQAACHRIHAPFVGLGVMVVAHEVQQPVRQQEAHLVEERPAAAARLAGGRVERDDDVTEPAALRAWRLVERKREHIRRAILAAVLLVE